MSWVWCFNAKFPIWRYTNITEDFDLADGHSNILKSQQKHNIAITTHSCMHNVNMNSITILCHHSHCHNAGHLTVARRMGRSQLKAVVLFTVNFACSSIFRFDVGLKHIIPSPMASWLRKTISVVNNSRAGQLHNQLIHPTDTVVYLQQRSPSSSLGAEGSLASFTTVTVISFVLSWSSWPHHPCLPPLSLFLQQGFIDWSHSHTDHTYSFN